MRISKETIIIGTVSIVFLGLMGYLIWHTPQAAPATGTTVSDLSLLSNPSSHMTGSAGAKVTMVEFGDYQCPACGAAYPIIKQVTDNYSSNPNFNFVFRNFPLPQHANAPEAAEAAEAAGAQGKYWQMHDALYEHQNDWADAADPLPSFQSYATAIGLDLTKFTSDVTSKKYESVIAADQNNGDTIGIDETPTVYINGVQAVDFTVPALEASINADLAK